MIATNPTKVSDQVLTIVLDQLINIKGYRAVNNSFLH